MGEHVGCQAIEASKALAGFVVELDKYSMPGRSGHAYVGLGVVAELPSLRAQGAANLQAVTRLGW